MAFNYTHWSSLIGKNKPHSTGHHNNMFSIKESAWGFVPAMTTGDRMVFTSCQMHGSIGPYKEMTDSFYSNYYTDGILELFEPQPHNGIQRFKIPVSGNYKFCLMGGYAGHNKWRNTYDTDFHTGLTINHIGSYTAVTSVNNNYLDRGCPGYVEGTISLSKDTIIDVLVGQSGESAKYSSYFSIAGSGGGASAVWIGGMPGNSGWIIAGGAGSNRNSGGYNSTASSVYGTTGTTGGSGSGGSNGAGGNDSYSGNYDSASGAGKTGHGSTHGDHRYTSINLDSSSNSLDSGGRGAVSGPQYVNSYTVTASYPTTYFYINSSHRVSQCGYGQQGGATLFTNSLSNFTNYYNGSATTCPDNYIPVNCVNGGFGGGGVGCWGGSGGGGGYSGGGAGDNGSPLNGAGAGSSYMSGFTYLSHNVHSKSTSYNSSSAPLQAIGTCTLTGSNTTIPSGAWRGNGFVALEKI